MATPIPPSLSSPDELLHFLHVLIQEHLSGSTRIPPSQSQSIVTVILSLSDYFLTPLPSVRAHDASWTAAAEKIRLVEITLEVLHRAAERVECLFAGHGEFTKSLFVNLVKLSASLEDWVNLPISGDSAGPLSTPSEIQRKVFQGIVDLLRNLGNNTGSDEPMWRSMWTIVDESLHVIHDLLALFPTVRYPSKVVFFSQPRVHPELQPAATSDLPFELVLENESQLSALLSLLLDATVTVLWSSLKCECFSLDLVRRATEATASLSRFFTAPTRANSTKRARSFLRVVNTASTIVSSSYPFSGPIRVLSLHIVRFRLEQGPRKGWDDVDRALAKVFDSDDVVTSSKRDAARVVEILCNQTWGAAGTALRDLALSYLRHAVARSEADILPLLQEANLVDEVYSVANPSRDRNGPIIQLGALDRAISQPKRLTQNSLIATMESAMNRVTDKDRSVRLKAGRLLGRCAADLYARGPAVRPTLNTMFDQIRSLLEHSKDPVKESLIVTLGFLGRAATKENLGHVTFLLVTQLGQQNPAIKGHAYMQLLSLTMHHKTTPYGLLSPFMSDIAPYLVSRIYTQPNLLAEACRFLCQTTTDFLSTTLSSTLPALFASCDTRALEQISKEVSRKTSHLFLSHSASVLAHIFLLPDHNQSTQALHFIVQVLIDAAESNNIDIQSIVKSCVVPLLTDLVVVLGDEDPARVELGLQALKKVERSLSTPTRGRLGDDLGVFLKSYILGLISHINDLLQDVQGKKSAASKCQILRSLGALVVLMGTPISFVAPQIMATLQTMINVPELAEVTLDTWYKFLSTTVPNDVGPHVGPTTASIVSLWPTFSDAARANAKRCLDFVVVELGAQLEKHLDEVADLGTLPELSQTQERLLALRSDWTDRDTLQRILDRASSDNLTVAFQSLRELKRFMLAKDSYVRALSSGDMFDPMAGHIIATLVMVACRDGDGTEAPRLLAFECIGLLGALDPDRCEIPSVDSSMIMLSNFTDEGESMQFALHLIKDVLVGAFRSTSDIKYQSHLAYAIQELLRFCRFNPNLLNPTSNAPVSLKVRTRWNSLPKHVLETVAPLLEARYTLTLRPLPALKHPIYPYQSTYREWIQLLTAHLISKASGGMAQSIFTVCRSAARNKDVGVARHLLPHLVLNILLSGDDEDAQNIRLELLAVLEDQINAESGSTEDKKLLCAQVVFNLLDHLNKWVRFMRQDVQGKKADNKRARSYYITQQAEEQLSRIDSILSSINQELMAKAALKCKAYARSLMNFEQLILALRDRSPDSAELPVYYERLHEIYANLDEADGMEGVSSLILSPSLEHQIRQHESTGRWTSAQSCWEVRLQQSPDNLDFHLGLLRCLRNLGHYDTLRTHVKGVLTRNPGWESALAGFQVESAWMVGAWSDVQQLVENTEAQSSPIVMARVLLATRSGNATSIAATLSAARATLGIPITASGVKGYRRCYDAVLDLHLTHELETICASMSNRQQGLTPARERKILEGLSQKLSARLEATLPTFRIREPVLSMRRTAFSLSYSDPHLALSNEIGKSWLASAKTARKAGQWQTAYSAVLQARQSKCLFSFIESAKLVKTTGEPLRALQELENAMRPLGLIEKHSDVIDLTDDDEMKKMKAKAQILRARWMNESDRFETTHILRVFQSATDMWPRWESSHYHLGQFHDECFKALSSAEQSTRGIKMNLYTVKFFAKAIKFGSKYVYQTVPRLLTIWLDLGENGALSGTETFTKLNLAVAKAIKDIPAYKWYTAFPQIVSRVGHTNSAVYGYLSQLISTVLREYPHQALWLFTSVVKSTKSNRGQRGKLILDQLKSNPQTRHTQVPELINQCLAMTNELLSLCDHRIDDESKRSLTMSKDFPRLSALGNCDLIIPLQESLTANLPPTSSLSSSAHQPFPLNAPTFHEFADEIEVMKSLAKPRKITIRGSDGQTYMFLGKPKDDLRKDARLMDFNSIINKLLKANSESRRRQLHIRTYGVVTLNEECGFIQWVPNTIPIRPVILKGYDSKGIKNWSSELQEIYKKTKDSPDRDAAQAFTEMVLPMFPPVFHEWFIETFPEPSAWLASRLAYGRTAAVMSMVGFILGLGDRHCENILLDTNTGDVVHVDFNCLFEKGKTLETPERVPFRLTQNLVDGLGVTGVEGIFRIACEVTMQLLRDHKDSLMSVLDAFIHDPLVEWEDQKRKMERDRRNNVRSPMELRALAMDSLKGIEKKLSGIYSTSKEKHEKEISTSNLVQMLIQEAISPANLWKMYPGWASWL